MSPDNPGQQLDPGRQVDPGRHGWPQRVVALALMLAAILVAGSIAGVAKTIDAADRRLFTDVDQDQVIRIGEHATLRITGVSLAGSLTEREALIATPGRYVMVEYEVVAGRREAPNVRTELHADGRTYRPVDTAYEPLPAGFAGNRASVFEVPTEALTGDVEIIFGESELVYSHQHWVRWRPMLSTDDITGSDAVSVSLPETKMWVAP